MSTLPSTENRKRSPSVYLVMLILATIFLLIAVVAMIMEMNRWADDYWRTKQHMPTVQVVEQPSQRYA